MMTQDDVLVTVAVLVYQNFELIFDCIHSILQQDYPNIQLIISDDGSEYFDQNYLYQYLESNKKNNIKEICIHQMDKNVGTSKNFNFALRKSKGKYIKFIAADDLFYDEDSLSKLVRFAENDCSNVVVARAPNYDHYLERQVGIFPSDEHWESLKAASGSPKEFFGIMSPYCLICAPAVLYLRQFLMDRGGADEQYIIIEDWPFWMRMIRDGERFSFLDDSVVIYRSGGVSNGRLNGSFARYLIEFAKVIQNECLAFPDFMKPSSYRKAKRSEREHRHDGLKLLKWNQVNIFQKVAFILHYFDIYFFRVLKKSIPVFWRIESLKRKMFIFGILLLSVSLITDAKSIFSIFMSENLAEFISSKVSCSLAYIGLAMCVFSILLCVSILLLDLYNSFKYSIKDNRW